MIPVHSVVDNHQTLSHGGGGVSTPYAPTCPACRDASPNSFYVSCQGCQARKARIEADRALSAAQVAGTDSTFGEIE